MKRDILILLFAGIAVLILSMLMVHEKNQEVNPASFNGFNLFKDSEGHVFGCPKPFVYDENMSMCTTPYDVNGLDKFYIMVKPQDPKKEQPEI